LCGDHQMTQKTRIPTLASLQRDAAKTPPPARREETPSAQLPAQRPRARPTLVAALAAVVVVAGLIGVGLCRGRPARGCTPSIGSDASDAILLGATLPLSVDGKLDEGGQEQLLNALRLALDEINQRDGVAGRRFAVRVCDNGGETPRLKQQVAWLIDHE